MKKSLIALSMALAAVSCGSSEASAETINLDTGTCVVTMSGNHVACDIPNDAGKTISLNYSSDGLATISVDSVTYSGSIVFDQPTTKTCAGSTTYGTDTPFTVYAGAAVMTGEKTRRHSCSGRGGAWRTTWDFYTLTVQ